ncbi:hypothetical protein [Arenibacter palladensis]|uniref:hypothetical protein n=1 Tax=Arenibacter palladensis TaxID=237373 RepID=UPI0026E2A462|nr:hypothetical protein [Arenibacter palladensis]MDO6602868.1 hypothetical protein [Arenibacter palladensis]
MKKELPEDTPKPADSILEPRNQIFNKKVDDVANMDNNSKLWRWLIRANWRHPERPRSITEGKDNYP